MPFLSHNTPKTDYFIFYCVHNAINCQLRYCTLPYTTLHYPPQSPTILHKKGEKKLKKKKKLPMSKKCFIFAS